jgi:hypothetical protein
VSCAKRASPASKPQKNALAIVLIITGDSGHKMTTGWAAAAGLDDRGRPACPTAAASRQGRRRPRPRPRPASPIDLGGPRAPPPQPTHAIGRSGLIRGNLGGGGAIIGIGIGTESWKHSGAIIPEHSDICSAPLAFFLVSDAPRVRTQIPWSSGYYRR